MKSGKNDKKSGVFLSYDKCLFGFGQILFNLTHMPAEHHEKSVVPAFFKVSIDYVNLISLSLEKRNYCFGKKSGKSLGFWIQKSVQTLGY